MKNNQDAVTANPLGCGSLWKIKNNNENGKNDWIATEFFQNSSQ
jgi:hypothetical protein